MKSHAQIEALIDELRHEVEIDSKHAEHHAIAIEVLELATTCLNKPTIIKDAVRDNQCNIRKEALQWVLSDL